MQTCTRVRRRLAASECIKFIAAAAAAVRIRTARLSDPGQRVYQSAASYCTNSASSVGDVVFVTQTTPNQRAVEQAHKYFSR